MSHVRVSGAWKAFAGGTGGSGTAVRVSGAWKSVEAMWIRESGAWKKFFEAANVSIANATLNGSGSDPGTATCDYRLESDGDIATRESPAAGFSDVGDWVTPKSAAGSDYEARLTKQSGTGTLSTGSEATWQSLGTTRTYGISQSGLGTKTYVGLLEIRRASDGTVLDTATIDMTANVTV